MTAISTKVALARPIDPADTFDKPFPQATRTFPPKSFLVFSSTPFPKKFPTPFPTKFGMPLEHQKFAEPTVDFNGLEVHYNEIELLGYALGYRNAYNAVQVAVSGEFTSLGSIIQAGNESSERDRLEILGPFAETMPRISFVLGLELGLMEGNEDGRKAGRSRWESTQRGTDMDNLQDELLEKTLYERVKTRDTLGDKMIVARIMKFLKNQPDTNHEMTLGLSVDRL